MFLAGVVSGPKEPPLNTLNHYLTPSVDALIELWQPGVKFSRTYNFEFGRIVLCALIAVICDLPGARKASGYASFSHEHFCNVCHCTLSNDGYGNTDYHSWTRRTDAEWRAHAQDFQAATDAEKRISYSKTMEFGGQNFCDYLTSSSTRCTTYSLDSSKHTFAVFLA